MIVAALVGRLMIVETREYKITQYVVITVDFPEGSVASALNIEDFKERFVEVAKNKTLNEFTKKKFARLYEARKQR